MIIKASDLVGFGIPDQFNGMEIFQPWQVNCFGMSIALLKAGL